jgi:hypothetical protein
MSRNTSRNLAKRRSNQRIKRKMLKQAKKNKRAGK